uniref:Uncharacterized protein n=1 Tax=Araneus ventricosus TaxID=182803 RepID=A0A4Y1ZRZ8_ARAVE|nr:hypothetical protein AVEN_27691-1 [Araneus ventricosus]
MEFEKNKKKRSVIRQLTTKLLTKIEVSYSKTDIAMDEKLENLRDFSVQLAEKLTELKHLDSQIETDTSVDELEDEIIQSQECQEKAIIWKGRLQRFINQHTAIATQNETSNNRTVPETKVMKMPRLQMSTFYGDSSKWLDFWNQFECTIHNNGNLSKTEKFTYLKSLLSGNALSAISGFVLSDRNYDSSIEILKDRFGRQDIVISSHMNKLLSIEPVRNISNVKALRKLFDECEIQIRSLESLNVTSGSYGNLLCPIILQKIPEELNFEFNRNRKEQSNDKITKKAETNGITLSLNRKLQVHLLYQR